MRSYFFCFNSENTSFFFFTAVLKEVFPINGLVYTHEQTCAIKKQMQHHSTNLICRGRARKQKPSSIIRRPRESFFSFIKIEVQNRALQSHIEQEETSTPSVSNYNLFNFSDPNLTTPFIFFKNCANIVKFKSFLMNF